MDNQQNETLIGENDLRNIFRAFHNNLNTAERREIVQDALRKAIRQSRDYIGKESEICITHVFLDTF